jgi:tRNA pseudouridine13 synthase
MSMWKVPAETLSKVKIKDITLRDFCRSDEPVNLGESNGNRFTVNIKGVGKDADKNAGKIVKELKGSIPNFFGAQRFGLRLNNHVVGKYILKGQFKEAVMSNLCDTGGEPEEATRAREELRATEDFKTAFHSFPDYLGFEKSVLNHLIQKPTDFVGALRVVPKKLRLMFVHSYQGYIFNEALSEYIEKGERPKELPMVGYGIELDEVTKKILDREGMKKEEFKIPSMPEMSLEGEMRDAFVEFKGFEIGGFNEGEANLRVRFSLPPGAYATMLLRELLK